MSDEFRIAILGNIVDCRTEAEVYVPRQSTDPVALVYDSESGWVVERLDDGAAMTSTLDAAVKAAQTTLAQFVNRKGMGAPAGLSGPGLSLWLMERGDGTAMGQRIK